MRLPEIQTPAFAIRLLGPADIRVQGQPLPPLRSRTTLWLLALLVLKHPRPVEREWIAGTLWPESDPEQGLANLRQRLAELRRVLGEEAQRLLTPSGRTLTLDLDGAHVDLIDFDADLERGDSPSLERALGLYRGELLEGCSEEWVLREREAREAAFLGALERLAERAMGQGKPSDAVGYLRRVVAIDPLRESAQRALMSALVADGNYAEVVQVYRALQLRLREQLNADPDAATTALLERLRREHRQRTITGRRDRASAAPSGLVSETTERLAAQGLETGSLSSLGSGVLTTVTLLFTDIEGSTQLWEKHPQAMRTALLRHDELLRRVIEAQGGEVFKTVGDAFYATFATASEALVAAMEAQKALASEVWPPETVLKVRMALHTGTVERRDNDYFGQTMNRAAGLLGLGHGGQTLLSSVTREMLGDVLPEGVSLQGLGAHRIKGVEQPIGVFELRHPGLPEYASSLRPPTAAPNNLPEPLTSFVGREMEIKEVTALLGRTRLLTLTGSGGCGKTRLATQVGRSVLEMYSDGVWLVELAALTTPAFVPQATANALGLAEQAGRPLLDTLADHLRPRSLLLILDNCEHLLAACASLVNALLPVCPTLTVLATSREALRTGGEQTWRVPSLLPPDPHRLPGEDRRLAEMVGAFDAARLFVERATTQRLDFRLSPANARTVARICSRLDGIPLALEMAAARVRAMTVEQIEARLDERFRLLSLHNQTVLPRQQTLRALMDWSYDLLSDPEQCMLRELSVFSGGFSLEAVEQVSSADYDALDLLVSLVDKSLVVFEEPAGVGRYRLLETVRQYAAEKLSQDASAAGIGDRHVTFFLELAEAALPHLAGPDAAVWLDRLEMEQDNLRGALSRCLSAPKEASLSRTQDASGLAQQALRLCGSLIRFWEIRGSLAEGRAYLAMALRRPGEESRTVERARALDGAGTLALRQQDFTSASELFREALSIRRELDDRRGMASTSGNLGLVARHQGDYTSARLHYEQSLALYRELGDRPGMSIALNNLGTVAYDQADYAVARALHEQNLAIRRQLGMRGGIAGSLTNLANVAFAQGDYVTARALREEALELFQELGDRRRIVLAMNNLGISALSQEDVHSAWTLFEESLVISREIEDQPSIALAFSNLAVAAQIRGDYATAYAHYQESLDRFRALGDRSKGSVVLCDLGRLLADSGDLEAARSAQNESLALQQEFGDRAQIALSLEEFGVLAALCTEDDQAAQLWGLAGAVRAEIGSLPDPITRPRLKRHQEATRERLGPERFDQEMKAGRALSVDSTIARLLDAGAAAASPPL
jgi:predicted ATPase/class 3 adenylate cyclase/Tfp pilus assembly protein PilF